MAKRAAVGIFNGNWKYQWTDGVSVYIETEEDRRARIEANKYKFGAALDALIAVDPNWEQWYDENKEIPEWIEWGDSRMVDGICQAMRERVVVVTGHCQGTFQKNPL